MKEKLLLIEDEKNMARMVELELTHEGYEVEKAFDGLSGLEMAEKEGWDLILLDIMLPGLSGMEVLRRLRKTSQVPVILLTARDAVVDKVSGLDSGADDYVTKPFVIEELLARIRVCLRKAAANTPAAEVEHVLSAGPVSLNLERHQVLVNGTPVELTLREFELLHCLLEKKDHVVTRDALLDRVWGYDYAGETNSVDVYIRFLRTKIDEAFQIKLIHTVRGVGYLIRDDK